MKIAGYNFPDQCPKDCLLQEDGQFQGGTCHRCPVFNCTGPDALLLPEEYRTDWARNWYETIFYKYDLKKERAKLAKKKRP